MKSFDIIFILPRQDIEPDLISETAETGWWQQVGHGVLTMEAIDNGLTVKIIDANTFDSHIEFLKYLQNDVKSKIVGITPSITSINNTLDILKVVKQTYESVITILGGHMVSQPITAKKFAAYYSDLIDAFCIGDGRGIFTKGLNFIIHNINNGYLNLIPIKECQKNQIYSNWSKILLKSFTSQISIGHPIDYKQCFDLERYWRKYKLNYLKSKKTLQYSKPVALQTMQGCPNRTKLKSCLFCNRMEKNLRYLDISIVLNELDNIINSGGDSVIIVEDNGILSNYEIAQEISLNWPQNIGIVFMYANIQNINIRTAKMLKRMNCERLFIGIESGDEDCLKSLGKNFTQKQILNAIRILSEHDIMVSPSFIVGAPPSKEFEGETKKSIKKTIELANKLIELKNVDLAFSNILTPYERSNAYDILINKIPINIRSEIENSFDITTEYLQELWCNYVLNIPYSVAKVYQKYIEELFPNFVNEYK